MRVLVVTILVLLVLSLGSLSALEISEEVVNTLEEKQVTDVIVLLKDDSATTSKDLETRKEAISEKQVEVLDELQEDFVLQNKYSTINGFSGEIKEEALKKLQASNKVEKILPVKPIKLFLDDSVPLLGGDELHNKSLNGYQLRGEGQTVCVIDTGIDYTHPAFGGCSAEEFVNGTCNKVIGGYDIADDDNDPIDFHGHGTHVAGIVASEDATYQGVAPEAKLVSLKVFNSTGIGNTAWAIAAIDWCVHNSTKFNISVITMSIGVTDSSGNEIIYSEACDSSDSSGLAAASSAAVSQGIFVDVSAGNSGSTTGITSPACGENVTSVGSTTKADAISGYNSGTILDLLAPGSSITSSILGSSFGVKSGTSMAAPHVAGAAVILAQYWKLAYDKTITPEEIELRLKFSGLLINDTRNGLLFPRIDLENMINPVLNYTSTSAKNNSFNGNLVNISSDVNLSNAFLEWYYSNGSIVNLTMLQVDAKNYYYSLESLSDGKHYYRVYANDSANSFGVTMLRTLNIDQTKPVVKITSPLSGSYLTGLHNFTVNVLENNVDTVLFSFDNASGLGFNQTPSNSSGVWSVSFDVGSLEDGLNSLTVLVEDLAGSLNRTERVSFLVDSTGPEIAVNSPGKKLNLTGSSILFNLTVNDALLSISNVLLSFDNSSGQPFNITLTNQSGNWLLTYDLSNLIEGNHIVTVLANDSDNNFMTQQINFTLDNTKPVVVFNTPTNGSSFNYSSGNQLFNITATDSLSGVKDVKFNFSNGTNPFVLEAEEEGDYWSVNYNVSNLANGTNTVTALVEDYAGNVAEEEIVLVVNNYFFTVDSSALSITKEQNVSFTCSAVANVALLNLSLLIEGKINETVLINGFNNQTTFSKQLVDGNYSWSCLVNNLVSSETKPLTVDITLPVVNDLTVTVTENSATLDWETNENTNFSLISDVANNLDNSFSTAHSLTLTALSSSTSYSYTLVACDLAGNCLSSQDVFTTSTPSSSGSSSSGGSGGSGGGGGSGGSSSSSTRVQNEPLIEEEVTLEEEPVIQEPIQELEEPLEVVVKEPVQEKLVQESNWLTGFFSAEVTEKIGFKEMALVIFVIMGLALVGVYILIRRYYDRELL